MGLQPEIYRKSLLYAHFCPNIHVHFVNYFGIRKKLYNNFSILTFFIQIFP